MSNFRVAVLASGSKGNATVIQCAHQSFLVDAGISCRQIVSRMHSIGLKPEALEGVFITHEHSDHIKGLETFAKKYPIPIYASCGTLQGVREQADIALSQCREMQKLTFGDVGIDSFAVSHDALEPLGYTFTEGVHKLAYVTDTGFITDAIKQAVQGAETILLEANHDVQMLKEGTYPYVLKKRILSTKGHLDNMAAGWLLAGMTPLPQEIFLAHLSQENNSPETALEAVQAVLAKTGTTTKIKIYVTSQDRVIKNFTGEDYHEENIFA